MKILRRSTIVAACVGIALAATSAPASAIIGGREATQTYPGMAALSIEYPELGTVSCGAALVTPRFLLTAAHCVSDPRLAPNPVAAPASRITARVGSNDRTSGGFVVTGKQVYLHPGWMWAEAPGKPVSDLALVELTSPTPVRLMPIALRQAGRTGPVRVIGWGVTAYPPPDTDPIRLRERDVTRLPSASCVGGFIGEGELCLSTGPCFGDSGGPGLQPIGSRHHGTPRWESMGITSRQTSDTEPCNEYSVYTDLTYRPFQIWIATMLLNPTVQPCTCSPARSRNGPDARRMDLLKPRIVA